MNTSKRRPALTKVRASSPARSMNMNLSGKAKYSVSRRKPLNDRAGHGNSASAGSNPTGFTLAAGNSVGAGSFGPSPSATDSTCSHKSSYSGRDTLGAARRNRRSRSRPKSASVIAGALQLIVSRSTATARVPSRPTACGLAGAASGRPDSRAASRLTGQTVASAVVRKRHGSPRTGSDSNTLPACRLVGPCASSTAANCTIVQDGIGAR